MSNGNHVEPDDSIAHLLQGPNAERRRTRQMPMKEETVEKTEDTTEKKTDEKTKVLVLNETWRKKLAEDARQFGMDEAIRQRFTKPSLPSKPKPKVKFVPTVPPLRPQNLFRRPAGPPPDDGAPEQQSASEGKYAIWMRPNPPRGIGCLQEQCILCISAWCTTTCSETSFLPAKIGYRSSSRPKQHIPKPGCAAEMRSPW